MNPKSHVRRAFQLTISTIATALGLLAATSGASAADEAHALPLLEPTFAPSAHAPLLKLSNAPAANDWTFVVAPYLWLPALDGDIVVRGRNLTANQDTDDVVEALETSVNFAFAGHFEAQRGRGGVFLDILYVDIGGDRETRRGTTIEADADLLIGELGLFYVLVPPEPGAKHPFRLDVIGGVRVSGFRIDLDAGDFGSVGRSRTWFDPFVGVRGELGLLEWLAVKARGDIGGFGISEGDTSDLVWNVEVAATFKLAKWLHVDLGYRWLDYDYEDGDGVDAFKFDATLNGPFVAVEFRF